MLLGGLIAGMTSYDNGDRGWSLFGHIMLGGLFGGAVGIAAGFVIGVLGPTIGGMGAIVLGDTMAMSGAFAAVGVAVEVLTAAAAGALVAAGAGALGNVMFSKRTGKEGATDKPSWVNKDMVDPNLTAQQNATHILNEKYGIGRWDVGPRTEYNRIIKWIVRTVFYGRR